MNTTTTISIVLKHLMPALEAIQQDIVEAERNAALREPPAKQEPPAKAASPSKKLLKVTEAAEFLGLSKATLYKLTMTRGIPYFKLGTRTMFSEERLLTRLKAREHTPDDLLPRRTLRR
jgi:excisionase family DNA binding protein